MSLPWDQALRVLCEALGKDGIDPGAGPEHLEQALRGHGLIARKAAIGINGLPEGEWAAALVRLTTGEWLPLLPGDLPVKAIEGATAAFVLIPHVDALAEVMPFIRRHKARLLEILGAGLIVNIFTLIFPLFGSFVYDKVLGNGITETLWALAIGLFLAIVIDFSVRALRYQLFERFSVGSEADIDLALFSKILNGRVASLPSVGVVLDKYKQILGTRDFLASGYLMATLDLPFLLLFLVAIFLIAGPLVLVPLVVGGLMLGAHVLLSIPAHDYEAQARRAGERRFSLLADVLTAHEAIIGEGFRSDLLRRWRKASLGAGSASGRARYWHSLAGAVSASSSNLAYVSVLVVGAYMVEDRLLTSGGLIAATMLTSRAIGTVASLVLLITRYKEYRSALTELDGLFPKADEDGALDAGRHIEGRILLTGLSCRLRPEGRPTLDGIELRIEPGEAVALVGRPGAGKTTLLRLLAGVIVPHGGQVLIDNVPVDKLASADLGRTIGYKPQEPSLFEGNLEDCIVGGRRGMPPEALRRALACSGLLPALDRGELSLATQIGPRGTYLSGGQRQMVALARALLGMPQLLLLDEPTTGLDAPSERALAQALVPLKGRHTLIVSTHAREILNVCDRIIVLDQGKIVADGPRDKIIAG